MLFIYNSLLDVEFHSPLLENVGAFTVILCHKRSIFVQMGSKCQRNRFFIVQNFITRILKPSYLDRTPWWIVYCRFGPWKINFCPNGIKMSEKSVFHSSKLYNENFETVLPWQNTVVDRLLPFWAMKDQFLSKWDQNVREIGFS